MLCIYEYIYTYESFRRYDSIFKIYRQKMNVPGSEKLFVIIILL